MPKYCPECRAERNRQAARARTEAIRADLRDKQATLRAILDPMRDYLADDMIRTAEEWITNLDPEVGDPVPLVPDRMPTGTATPAGPDEGATTEYVDLDAELEARRLAAASHPWHEAHPGWWEED